MSTPGSKYVYKYPRPPLITPPSRKQNEMNNSVNGNQNTLNLNENKMYTSNDLLNNRMNNSINGNNNLLQQNANEMANKFDESGIEGKRKKENYNQNVLKDKLYKKIHQIKREEGIISKNKIKNYQNQSNRIGINKNIKNLIKNCVSNPS